MASTSNRWPEVIEQIPDYALLMVPPFPAVSKTISNLQDWSNPGVWKKNSSTYGDGKQGQSSIERDSHGNPLVHIGASDTPSESHAIHRQQRRFANGGGLVHLPSADCFKLGQESSTWIEPEGTGRPRSYEVSRPPFERLMTATRDFIESRSEALQTMRTKRLFEQMRSTFGIRSDMPGRHWSGSGPDGQPYIAPRTTTRTEGWMDLNQIPMDDEVCVLLRHPEQCLRGYVALLRREFEAGWDISPSIKMAEMMASFFAYIDHYKVFTDSPLDKQFAEVARLASIAPRLLREAHAMEENIGDARGLNRASWTIWGGQYGGAERGGLEQETSDWPTSEPPPSEAGGWAVQSPIDDRPMPLAADQVISHIKSILAPVDNRPVVMLGHIPYARRLITAVLPPLEISTGPKFQQRFHRLVTAPAPWNDAEGWRRQTLPPIVSENADTPDPSASGVLEGELATIAEPNELTIWVESEALQNPDGTIHDVVGMGLRGRWGMFGMKDGSHSWWAFKAKDYILPAIWLAARGRGVTQT